MGSPVAFSFVFHNVQITGRDSAQHQLPNIQRLHTGTYGDQRREVARRLFNDARKFSRNVNH
jgi:hypothetical protein